MLSYLFLNRRTPTVNLFPRFFQRRSVHTKNEIRNIGIIAHIDAGKTTTTERMLYFSGFSKFIGNVDDGTTVMDFLPEERKRGITIQSAAITFGWPVPRSLSSVSSSPPLCQINLIDTPGHVDFTFEVERSLSVLDGVITLIDSVEGVQAQTRTVWKQANQHALPRIVFFNKLDRMGAKEKWEHHCQQLQHQLIAKAPFVVTQVPIFQESFTGNPGSGFAGVLDLIEMKLLKWNARKMESLPIPNESTFLSLLENGRRSLVEQLGNMDDQILNLYLETENPLTIPPELLYNALSTASKSQRAIPVLFGASFRDAGIQPLLDAIVDYLPSPAPADQLSTLEKKDVCAFVFKVVYDVQRSTYLSYVRVYSGTLLPRQVIMNRTNRRKERIQRILMVYANETEDVASLGPGSIGVLLGLKDTSTGDFLGSPPPPSCCLPTFTVPPPVMTRAIEPTSLKAESHLKTCLEHVHKEDPSIRVSEDPDTCQYLVSGMGELHLEIVAHRLSELGAQGTWGPLTIAYREILTEDAEGTVEDKDGNVTHLKLYKLYKDNEDILPANPGNRVQGDPEQVLQSSVNYGPLGYPVVMLGVDVVQLGSSFGLHSCFLQLLKGRTQLVEPVMRIQVQLNGYSQMAPVLADLAKRKGRILEVTSHSLVAVVPLINILGYATALRGVTAGHGTYEMQLEGYTCVQSDANFN